MRLLTATHVTSINHQAQTIHSIHPDRTVMKYIEAYRELVLVVYTSCGQTVSPKWTMLLNEKAAHEWSIGDGELAYKYGSRKQCKWCHSWSDQ